MRVKVAASGGVDSTFLLWLLAQDASLYIEAVYFLTSPWGAISELVALRAVLAWIKENMGRDIPLHVETVQPAEWMAPTIMEVGGRLMDGFDEFYTGRGIDNGRQTIDPSLSNDAKIAHYRALFSRGAPGKVLRFPLTERGKGRPHAIAEMPRDLFSLTFGCYKPQIKNGVLIGKCGKCPKCLMDKYCVDRIDQGARPDDICNEILKMRGSGPYASDGPMDGRYSVPTFQVGA